MNESNVDAIVGRNPAKQTQSNVTQRTGTYKRCGHNMHGTCMETMSSERSRVQEKAIEEEYDTAECGFLGALEWS